MTETRDPLLTTLTIKGLVLCNRVFSASHSISYDDGGMPAEHYQSYHEEKARGGIALTMFGGSATVAVDSPSVFGQLNVSHDRVIPYFEAVRRTYSRTRRCADVPDYPHGSAHFAASGRLAPFYRSLAGARRPLRRHSQSHGRARHRAMHQGLRCCGAALFFGAGWMAVKC